MSAIIIKEMYKNKVEENGPVLLVALTMDKTAVVDNNDRMKEILTEHKFHAIKRGEDIYYASSMSKKYGRLYLARLVLGNDAVAGGHVAHKDGNSLNCCAANLIVKTRRQLLVDAKQLRNPVVGIYKRRNGWMVAWFDSLSGKQRYKMFSTKKMEPGRAYELAVRFRMERHDGSLLVRNGRVALFSADLNMSADGSSETNVF